MIRCKRCDGFIQSAEHAEEFCSEDCRRWWKQDNCKHPIMLDGYKEQDDSRGYTHKVPVYYCPECKTTVDK